MLTACRDAPGTSGSTRPKGARHEPHTRRSRRDAARAAARPRHAARSCAPPVALGPRRPPVRLRSGSGGPAGDGAARRPGAQQGRGVHGRGARCARSPRAPPAACRGHRPAGEPGAGARPPQDGRPRAVRRPRRAPGSERDAVPPRARRSPRGAAPDRVHADGRSRLPGLQPPLPAPARRLDHPRRRGPGPGDPAPRRPRRDPADRRHRQRAHPGPRRPGGRRHGHPDRQARPVLRDGRDPPGVDPSGLARRRHGPRSAPGRPAVPGLAPPATQG